MSEKFNADKLQHVKGYEGPISDIDKAHAMAENEDYARSLVDEYKNYCETGAFPRTDKNYLGDAFFDKWFGGMKKAGITPEYFLKADEVLSVEVEAAVEDFIEKARSMTPDEREREAEALEAEANSPEPDEVTGFDLERTGDYGGYYSTDNVNKILKPLLAASKLIALRERL